MRCICCDRRLSDKESTRKGVNTGEYLDMCDGCFSTVADDFPYIEGHGASHVPPDNEPEEEWNDDGTWADR